MEKYGGHKAAGGFSLLASKLEAFKQRLSIFSHQCLKTQHLQPLVMIDAQANFKQLTPNLYQSTEQLQPCGIEILSLFFGLLMFISLSKK